MTDLVRELQQFRTLLESTIINEAPSAEDLEIARRLLRGPQKDRFAKIGQQASKRIFTKDMQDLLDLSPEQFGQKHARVSQYLQNPGIGRHDEDRQVAATAEIARDAAVRDMVKQYRAETGGGQPQAAAAQPAQAAQATAGDQPAQVVPGQMRGTPRVSPGDPGTTQAAKPTQAAKKGGGDFNAAFKAARLRGEEKFNFGGKPYHTRRKAETEPFWKAKMKLIRDSKSLTPDEIKTLQGNRKGLGPDEAKRVDQLAQLNSSTFGQPAGQTAPAGQAQPATPQGQPAAGGAPGGQMLRGPELANFIRNNREEANRIVAQMIANNLVESRAFLSRVITEAPDPEVVLGILFQPNHPKYEQYVKAFNSVRSGGGAAAQPAKPGQAAQPAAPAQPAAAANDQTFKQQEISAEEINKLTAAGMTGAAVAEYRKMRQSASPEQIARQLLAGGYQSGNWTGDARVKGRILQALVANKVIDPQQIKQTRNVEAVKNNLGVYKTWVEQGKIQPAEIGRRATMMLGTNGITKQQFPALAKEAGWSDDQIKSIAPHIK